MAAKMAVRSEHQTAAILEISYFGDSAPNFSEFVNNCETSVLVSPRDISPGNSIADFSRETNFIRTYQLIRIFDRGIMLRNAISFCKIH